MEFIKKMQEEDRQNFLKEIKLLLNNLDKTDFISELKCNIDKIEELGTIYSYKIVIEYFKSSIFIHYDKHFMIYEF